MCFAFYETYQRRQLPVRWTDHQWVPRMLTSAGRRAHCRARAHLAVKPPAFRAGRLRLARVNARVARSAVVRISGYRRRPAA